MPTIAIFDSGVGGLSIYQEIRRVLPESGYMFVSDNKAYPYGTKSEAELIARVLQVVERVIKHYSPDMLVIACNTASTVVLSTLRAKFTLPIVGVVPAIKPAAKISQTRTIGLLATPATINRAYTDQLIADFAADCKVIRLGSNVLVQLAEDKLHGRKFDVEALNTELQPLLDHPKMDVLVLACTHFPLINNEIQMFFKENNMHILLLDSAQGIAQQVARLASVSASHVNKNRPASRAVFTQNVDRKSEFIKNLHGLGLTTIEVL